MDFLVRSDPPAATNTPLLACFVTAEETLPASLGDLFEPDDFQAHAGQSLLLYPREHYAAARVLLVGLGNADEVRGESLRRAAGSAVRQAHDLKLTSLALALPTLPSMATATVAEEMVVGASLATYRYVAHKTTSRTPEDTHRVTACTLLAAAEATEAAAAVEAVAAVEVAAHTGAIIADGVALARDVMNAPGNVMVPAAMAQVATDLEQYGLRVTVLDKAALTEQGFGGILAVGGGSAHEPRFIIIEHGTAQAGHPTVCFVGKGVTFDTGGISLKPAQSMDAMKMDMGGAAAVLGTMHNVARLQLPLHVVGLIGAAENMPDGAAYKPGDVITTLSGKTVEVLNTDAEGRIVMADALHYAQRYEPSAVIDLATLTGAMVVALGGHATGMMTNDETLAAQVQAAGEATQERVWQMPLWDEYLEMVKSEIADVNNTGGTRNAGAITAAAFLATFVDDMPWVHLDIAGTATVDSKPAPYETLGARGVGVRLLTRLLQDRVQQ